MSFFNCVCVRLKHVAVLPDAAREFIRKHHSTSHGGPTENEKRGTPTSGQGGSFFGTSPLDFGPTGPLPYSKPAHRFLLGTKVLRPWVVCLGGLTFQYRVLSAEA